MTELVGSKFNFASHLFERNRRRPNKPAYIDDSGFLSYGDLEDRARRFANALLKAGIRREERIFLLTHDRTEWPICFLGSMYTGIVPVAVNTLLTAKDYGYMLEHSRSQLAVVSAEILPTFRSAVQESRHELEKIIVVGEPDEQRENEIPFDTFIESQLPFEEPAATNRNDPGFWLYSSGSTGRPKGTVHTHANPFWTAELYGKGVLGIRESDVCFSAAKLFFAYGLGNALSFPLSVGATTILFAGRPTPDEVFKRWKAHQPTVFFGAPTGYAAMLASPALPNPEETSLRLCSSAGEALPADLGERFTKHFGIDIYDGIGSTEMLHIFLSNAPGRIRFGTSGWPVSGYDIEIRGDDQRPVGDGEIGDLFIRGPSAALAYWGQRGKSQETFQGAWTKSGDKYQRNQDGSYTCIGRSDDMFKVSGMYVSPFEVEGTLVEHSAVLESAVVGVSNSDGLIRSKAFVVLKDGASASEEELQEFVKERLAPYKYPRSIEFVSELPKTATGKVMRFRLR